MVVIENKLDDTGKDVVWQSLKYASYCSSLDAQGIKNIFSDYLEKSGKTEEAQKLLEEFLVIKILIKIKHRKYSKNYFNCGGI